MTHEVITTVLRSRLFDSVCPLSRAFLGIVVMNPINSTVKVVPPFPLGCFITIPMVKIYIQTTKSEGVCRTNEMVGYIQQIILRTDDCVDMITRDTGNGVRVGKADDNLPKIKK